MHRRLAAVGLFWSLISLPALGATLPWKAGTAKVEMTPKVPLWMAGYASRTGPSQGVHHDLFIRVLALEDSTGKRAVLVTTDMLGFPAPLSRRVADRAAKQFKLSRDQLLLSSTHTHGGPVVDRLLGTMYNLSPEQWAAVESYTRQLEENILAAIGAALKDLQPASLSFTTAKAGFGVNRRAKGEKGFVIGVNPDGPVDPDVPVLVVEGKGGQLRAVLFSYACHNTTARDFMQFHGDYSGFAEARLEAQHPGAVALFMSGCGADINPNPRGTIELAQKYGEELAEAIQAGLAKPKEAIRPPLKSTFQLVPVAFAPPPTRKELQARLQDKEVYVRRHAAEMLNLLDRDGRLPTSYPYPIQVWRFGSGLTLIALAGEVVVDYSLRLKRELGAERTWVVGYCNDVFAYIPSRRVLEEGGYEGRDAMIYYGLPGPFAPEIEETIIGKVHSLIGQLGNRTARRTVAR